MAQPGWEEGMAALHHLLPKGFPVESNLPSGGRVGLMEQPSPLTQVS